ncbi:glycosyl transferase 2 family protein, partial [Yersinia pestis PY-54]
MILIA